MRHCVIAALLAMCSCPIAHARAVPKPDPVAAAAQAIVIDGRLDEPAWQHAYKRRIGYEFHPHHGRKAPVRTDAWITYDKTYLYVAFHAYDPDPGSIRAHLSGRDHAFADDWVEVMLDTFNDHRRAYEFIINPLGVQGDGYMDDLQHEESIAFDAIWRSAGRVTDDGYIVELAIPFRQLRFRPGSSPRTWGIMLVRNYPRDSHYQLADVDIDPDRSCFLCQMRPVRGFAEAHPGHNLRLTPSLTAVRSRSRDAANMPYSDAGSRTEAGLDAHWGITPDNTLAATLNPDFSTVESDVAQLGVNRQFALYYPERRPFFLDGADQFSTPNQIIYTRNVVDPDWGAKLTGHAGKQSYGVFAADDNVTNLLFPGAQGSSVASYALSGRDAAMRYGYDFGQASGLGLVGTQRSAGDYHNRVLGLDGRIQVGESGHLNLQALRSNTRYAASMLSDAGVSHASQTGDLWHLEYGVNTRNYDYWAQYEKIDAGFRADLGFVPQVGYRKWVGGTGYHWYGAAGDWYDMHGFDLTVNNIAGPHGDTLDRGADLEYSLLGPWQSHLSLTASRHTAGYAGRLFDQNLWILKASFSPTTLDAGMTLQAGESVDYANVREARLNSLAPYATLQFGRHVRAELQTTRERLTVSAGRVYTAWLADIRLYYQFDRRAQLRFTTQYQSILRNPALYQDTVERRSRDWAAQMLFTYQVSPQTVFYLGYGRGYANREGLRTLFNSSRTAVLKLSYAWEN